jgi:hypothetical protein
MRRLPLIVAAAAGSVLVAACSSTTATAPVEAALSSGTHQSCASTLQTWLRGPGGSDLHSALTAGSAMGAALASGSPTRVSSAAPGLNSAAGRAGGRLPPACADHGSAYRIAMRDWMAGAADATDGNLRATSSRIATGAQVMDAATLLRRLSPTLLRNLSRPAAIPAESATPAPAPAVTTAAPSTVPAVPAVPTPAPSTPSAVAVATQASATPAGCYPVSDEGTCYKPGEYCRDDDHGTSGVAGDGEAITCEDNDGWRWEPS